MSSYTIVGGGISGLAAAFYLKRLPQTKSITVLEAASRLGGWVQTTRHEDGAIFEHGPRTIRAAGIPGANTLQLVEDIGLDVRSIHSRFFEEIMISEKSFLFKNHPHSRPMFFPFSEMTPRPKTATFGATTALSSCHRVC